jgi:hypothetical protein
MPKKFWKGLAIALPISILMCLLIIRICFGATYYVDSAVTDTNPASATPDFTTYDHTAFTETGGFDSVYKNLADINTLSTLAAGDSVLFRKGQEWTANGLIPAASGVDGNPIIFGTFGSGNPPVISKTSGSIVDTNTKSYLRFVGLCFTGAGRVYVNAGQNIDLFYCVAKNHPAVTHMISVVSSPGCRIYNCVVVNCWAAGVSSQGTTTTIDLKNSIVVGCGETNNNGVYQYQGAITYTNCLITGNGNYSRPAANISGGTDGGGNMLATKFPYLITPYNQHYINIRIDDQQESGYVTAVAAAIAPYKLTWAVNELNYGPLKSEMVALHAAGHEIVNHGRTHNNVAATTLFAVTSTNTSPTVNVDRANSQIIFYCTEVGNRVTVAWSSTTTLADVKTAVAGKGWTITNTTYIYDKTFLTSMADSSGAQACPYTVNPDISAGNNYPFWADEITANGVWINSVIGVTPTIFAYPHLLTSDGVITFLKDVGGFLGASYGETTASRILESLVIYKIASSSVTLSKGDGAEETIRNMARYFAAYTMYGGNILSLMSHNSTEFSVVQWGWLADELRKNGANVVTLPSAIASIRADHSTADGLTYTKTYTDLADYHLQPTSPAINAGVDVGLTQDYEGKSVPKGFAIDIGAYEFAGSAKSIFRRRRQ